MRSSDTMFSSRLIVFVSSRSRWLRLLSSRIRFSNNNCSKRSITNYSR